MLIILPILSIISSASSGGGEDYGYSSGTVVAAGAGGVGLGAAGHYAYSTGQFTKFIEDVGKLVKSFYGSH